MEFRMSERMNYIKASEIRELLKLTENPDIISFAGGLPAPELFPLDELIDVSKRVLRDDGKSALQYSTTEGYRPLRQIIAKQRMKSCGVDANQDNILITNGSQQGIDFSGKIFIDKGDTIICESPSYLGAINAFNAYMPNFVEIPMDNQGMIIEKLEEALQNHPDTKFIYTIPDFQNPTGITLSLNRRKQMIELAEKFNTFIIEDSPYIDLRFEGDKIPSIKSLDKYGRVIYLGTFSKTFCPGLRLGWVCADEKILSKYIIVKQGADLQASSISQREAALFMQEYDLNKHIVKIIDVYRKRRDKMIYEISNKFPVDFHYTIPQGGLFLWVEMPDSFNSTNLLKKAIEKKVAFVPGYPFYPNGGHNNTLRINYSNMDEERITEGIARLSQVIKEHR